MTGRHGISLSEVVIATGVMTVLFVPIMFTFLTSTGGAGQDVREVRATMLAQEMLEQVIAVSRLPKIHIGSLPLDNCGDPSRDKEVDVDDRLKKTDGAISFPLWEGPFNSYLTRVTLSPPVNNFRRFLSIAPEKVGKNRGTLLLTPVLYRVTAHVQFVTPVAGGEVVKHVRLTTFLSTDSVQIDEEGE